MNLHSFDIEKVTQVLYKLSNGYEINYMKLIKLLFFADRYHIRKYGDLISNDEYFAVKLGPIQSETKDIVTKEKWFYNAISPENQKILNSHIVQTSKYTITINKIGDDLLSESDIEAINFSVDTFNKFNEFELSNITHDYPEWYTYSYIFDANPDGRKNIDEKLFFQKPDKDKQPNIMKHFDGIDPFDTIDESIVEVSKNNYLNYILDGNHGVFA
jgi:uncharacterized phage-associated protein